VCDATDVKYFAPAVVSTVSGRGVDGVAAVVLRVEPPAAFAGRFVAVVFFAGRFVAVVFFAVRFLAVVDFAVDLLVLVSDTLPPVARFGPG
jgi:hypothetical protein